MDATAMSKATNALLNLVLIYLTSATGVYNCCRNDETRADVAYLHFIAI